MKRIALALLLASACSTPSVAPCQAETDCAGCQSCVDGACQNDASKLNACGTCGEVAEVCGDGLDNDCDGVVDNGCALCGNGQVDVGEKCDGNCPTGCDDNVACTKDTLTGSASSCNAVCTHAALTACVSGDRCCPSGCNHNSDSDCSVSCGNGVVEAGEKCDGNCPSSCNDNVACTKDTLTGSASSCNAVCAHVAIAACVSGDGCCPSGCNHNSDSDCAVSCGNGVVEAGEQCDRNCPTGCNDSVACTKDTLTGSAASCNAVCTHVALTACVSGDGCCPSGCNHNSDSDCSASCGNGVVEAGEKCDGNCPTSCNDNVACTNDSLIGSASSCSAECLHQAISSCTNGDGCCAAGCNSTNDNDCAPQCGNGVVETGEKCDGTCPASCSDSVACTQDTLTGSAALCTAACTHVAIAACVAGDGCCPSGCDANHDSDCPSRCNNGVVEPGEICDRNCPSTCNDADACTTDTLMGSASMCNAQCTHAPVTACTSGDGCCPAGCTGTNDSDCAKCGNGVVETGELCDGTCPTSCPDDGDPCTVDSLTGSAAACNAKCTHTQSTACQLLTDGTPLAAGVLLLASYAPVSVLENVANLSTAPRNALLADRAGPDGVLGTADDKVYEKPWDLQIAGFGSSSINALIAYANSAGLLPDPAGPPAFAASLPADLDVTFYQGMNTCSWAGVMCQDYQLCSYSPYGLCSGQSMKYRIFRSRHGELLVLVQDLLLTVLSNSGQAQVNALPQMPKTIYVPDGTSAYPDYVSALMALRRVTGKVGAYNETWYQFTFVPVFNAPDKRVIRFPESATTHAPIFETGPSPLPTNYTSAWVLELSTDGKHTRPVTDVRIPTTQSVRLRVMNYGAGTVTVGGPNGTSGTADSGKSWTMMVPVTGGTLPWREDLVCRTGAATETVVLPSGTVTLHCQ